MNPLPSGETRKGREVMRWIILGVVTAGFLMPAPVGAQSGGHIYVSPTIGLWKWDQDNAEGLVLADRSTLVLGGRVGYAPIEAFAGELVFLTGSNDGTIDTGAAMVERSLRLTQTELSLLVNFQSIISPVAYPFLDLGIGLSIRSGGEQVEEESVFDETRFNFHIGGGVKVALSPRAGLRFNIRDTFFTDTQNIGGQENQTTVDSVELSAGLEYRFWLARRRGGGRLR